MSAIHLLVIEGNTAETQQRHAAATGMTPGESYAAVLRSLQPGAEIQVCAPADPQAELPGGAGLESYDGAAITGSALNIYRGEPEALRQIDLARSIFTAGIPFFGSCWGLQVAVTAAGGTVRKSDRGREVGIARKIFLTDAGARHPLHSGKGPVFDAPAIHSDEVADRPEGMTVTASNRWCDVQAAEIRHDRGVFWGVQYHPEYTLGELATTLARNEAALVGEGIFASAEDARRYVADLKSLDSDPSRRDIAWRLGLDADILDPRIRLAELANWLAHQVLPFASRRGRA